MCIGCEITSNVEPQKELELLYIDILERDISIIARDVENDKIVGVVLNIIQVVCLRFQKFQNSTNKKI